MSSMTRYVLCLLLSNINAPNGTNEPNVLSNGVTGLVCSVVRVKRAALTQEEIMAYRKLIRDPDWARERTRAWAREFAERLVDALERAGRV